MKKLISLALILTLLLSLSGYCSALGGIPAGASMEPSDFTPISRDILLTGSSYGLGDADEIINGASLRLTLQADEPNQLLIGAQALFGDSEPVNAILSIDKSGLGFALPDISDTYYTISFDTLQEIASSYAEEHIGNVEGSHPDADAIAEVLSKSGEYTALFQKYGDIISGLITEENLTETEADYTLDAFGETVACTVVEFCPTLGDWQRVIHRLLTTAQTDKDLEDLLIVPAAKFAFSTGVNNAFVFNERMFVNMVLIQFRDALSSALESADALAEQLAGHALAAALDGSRVCALKLTDNSGDIAAYESFGTPETVRRDAIVYYDSGAARILAQNSLRVFDQSVSGKFIYEPDNTAISYDLGLDDSGKPFLDGHLSSPELAAALALVHDEEGTHISASVDTLDAGGEFSVLATESGTRLTMPDLPVSELLTEEDISAAFDAISDDLHRAALFGHERQESDSLFDESLLTFEDDGAGYPRLFLTDDQMSALSGISIVLLRDYGDGLLFLGNDYEAGFLDEDGALVGEFQAEWMYVNGYEAVYYQTNYEESADGHITAEGVIPVEYQGRPIFLL